MICILFNRIHFITRERGTCSHTCASKCGQLSNKAAEWGNDNTAAFPSAVVERGAVGFSLCSSTQQPGAETGRLALLRSAATASRSADISPFSPPLFTQHTHTRGSERRRSRRKCGRERHRQEIWFPSECAPYKNCVA